MSSEQSESPVRTFRLDPRNVWQVGLVVLGLVALGLFIAFVVDDGGSVIFTLLMAWFAALAMQPAVGRLSRRMRRGLATGIVMATVGIAIVLFMVAFGQLFVSQIASLLETLPALADQVVAWASEVLGRQIDVKALLAELNINPQQVAIYASEVVGGVLGFLGTILGGFFSLFTFALFTFYFAADGPRLRRWIASFFPPRRQATAMQFWDVTAQKVGGYVAARVILATINGTLSAVVFLVIGMPSWLALGIWTGVVAQFVPTIGTYIAIVLPVLVGLLSGNPMIGLIALAWGILYQQVENLTIEPRISAKAVNVHPAVAFAAVMMGAALFGVAGALLAVPVAAMLVALGEFHRTSYSVSDEVLTGTYIDGGGSTGAVVEGEGAGDEPSSSS